MTHTSWERQTSHCICSYALAGGCWIAAGQDGVQEATAPLELLTFGCEAWMPEVVGSGVWGGNTLCRLLFGSAAELIGRLAGAGVGLVGITQAGWGWVEVGDSRGLAAGSAWGWRVLNWG